MFIGLDSSQYGLTMIPVILERLPDSVKLQVSIKQGQDFWNIAEFMACIRSEVDARENCDFGFVKKQYDNVDKFTTHSLANMQE